MEFLHLVCGDSVSVPKFFELECKLGLFVFVGGELDSFCFNFSVNVFHTKDQTVVI